MKLPLAALLLAVSLPAAADDAKAPCPQAAEVKPQQLVGLWRAVLRLAVQLGAPEADEVPRLDVGG